jgi:hypothetical protein
VGAAARFVVVAISREAAEDCHCEKFRDSKTVNGL